MKCENCGAEIGKSIKCPYCGTQITYKQRVEQQNVNKAGCPKCGSANIQFRRENHGEVRYKNSKKNVYKTVGFCKDCGETWFPSKPSSPASKSTQGKSYTWLWIFGFIVMFPIPVSILVWRSKKIPNAVKYAIIAAVWLLFFTPSMADYVKKQKAATNQQNIVQTEIQQIETTTAETDPPTEETTNAEAEPIILKAGVDNEYSETITLNAGSEASETNIVYFLPEGIYNAKNTGDYPAQITVYSREIHTTNDGWEEPSECYFMSVVAPEEEIEIEIGENQYIEIHDPAVFEVIPK